jgi:hypothetical protein
MSPTGEEAILTLEPLIEAVREGMEAGGWELSGLQKTTSHQFEGRWEGESTRSAYLFFHSPTSPEPVSVDVYLDETSRGLAGNLALVVDLVELGELGDASEALGVLGRLSSDALPDRYGTPITLRLRLRDGKEEPSAAEGEVRFKLRLPKATIVEGPAAVRRLAGAALSAFEDILGAPELKRYVARD